jgi:hypothetical protein
MFMRLGSPSGCRGVSTIRVVFLQSASVARIQPLRQSGPIDVHEWAPDAEFGVFPEGAREKEALIAPGQPLMDILVPNKRYLYKLSRDVFPEQFWAEVVAYRIGCLLGLQVPPAFYALNSGTHTAGALIEWFYDGAQAFVHGGDFMLMVREDYDRDRGRKHNLADIELIMRAMRRRGLTDFDYRQWWVDALVFDALIGNRDRHQDNWGLVFSSNGPAPTQWAISPLFDNGSSLGYELMTDRVRSWDDDRFNRYVARGIHHVKWDLNEVPPVNGHLALLRRAVNEWPNTAGPARARLDVTTADLEASVSDLLALPGRVPLSPERYKLMLRLMTKRLQNLKELLDEFA